MPLGPEDVIRRTFRTTRIGRGYIEAEVDTFKEEVVDELRRLHAKVDELEAARVRPLSLQQLDEEQESGRVARERAQLDIVHAERRELVAELTSLQARLDMAKEDIAAADSRVAIAEKAVADAESRRADVAAAEAEAAGRLQRLAHEHDVLRGAHDGLVQELRGLRLAAEARASKVLGEDDPQRLEQSGGGQEADIAVIAALATRLHESYVEQGRQEAENLREDARGAAERLRAEADAKAQEASAAASELLAAADQQARAVADQARSEHDRLISEAEQERAGVLADLQARRDLLERRVAELDEHHNDYRERMIRTAREHLHLLEARETERLNGAASRSPVR